MFQYLGNEIDPLEMNEKLKVSGCFTNGAFYIRESITKAFPELTETNYWGYPLEEVKQALEDANKIVILGVDFNPIINGYQSHYVGLYNLNQIVDPNGGVLRPINHYGKIVQTIIITKSEPKKKEDMPTTDTYNDALMQAKKDWSYNDLSSDMRHALEVDRNIAYPVSILLSEIKYQKGLVDESSSVVLDQQKRINDLIYELEVQNMSAKDTNVPTKNQKEVQDVPNFAENVQNSAQSINKVPIIEQLFPQGRIFGISKKLTVAISALPAYTLIIDKLPPELLDYQIRGVPLSVWLIPVVGVLSFVYIVVQGIIDLSQK